MKITNVVNMSDNISISATEANRSFSKLLREVGSGKRVTITSHGRPVARILPPENEDVVREKRAKALAALKARWATQEPITVGPWTRDDLYERD
jgi:prevent-host-death family protein